MYETGNWLQSPKLDLEILAYLKAKNEIVPTIAIYKKFIFIRPHEIDAALEKLHKEDKIEKSLGIAGYPTKWTYVYDGGELESFCSEHC